MLRAASVFALTALVALFSSGCALKSPAQPCACSAVSLQDLKPMIGSWHGKMSDGKRIEVVTREVSGGTAIEETLSPGTPHEMVSLYSSDGAGVQMTHYCMLGNQPVLKAQRISANEILFQFTEGKNIVPGKGKYMSEMKLTFVEPGHIREEWVAVSDGNRESPVVFDLWNGSGCKGACKTGGCKAGGCKTKIKSCGKSGCTKKSSGAETSGCPCSAQKKS